MGRGRLLLLLLLHYHYHDLILPQKHTVV